MTCEGRGQKEIVVASKHNSGGIHSHIPSPRSWPFHPWSSRSPGSSKAGWRALIKWTVLPGWYMAPTRNEKQGEQEVTGMILREE